MDWIFCEQIHFTGHANDRERTDKDGRPKTVRTVSRRRLVLLLNPSRGDSHIASVLSIKSRIHSALTRLVER